MKQLLCVFALCVALVGCVDTDETLVDEPEVEEVMRETAPDDPADVEIGMSEVQQVSVSSTCSGCVASRCNMNWFYCYPSTRYHEAHQCYLMGRCTYAEYQSFKPRTQEP